MVEQTGGVREHPVPATDAQAAELGAGAGHRAHDPVAVRVAVRGAHHGGGGAAAQGEGCELLDHLFARDVVLAQPCDGRLVPRGGVLAGHHEGVLDGARVDHGGGHGEGVDEAQARVGHVEVQGGAGQAQALVDPHGHGGLVVVARDGRVDEQSDLLRADAGVLQGGLAGLGGAVGEVASGGPAAALLDAREPLQQTLGKAQPCEGLGQLLIEPGGRDHHVRFRLGHRQDGGVAVSDGGVTGQCGAFDQTPPVPSRNRSFVMDLGARVNKRAGPAQSSGPV